MELLTPDEMRAVDALAIREAGIPGAVLMENAGMQAASVIRKLFENGERRFSATIIAGKGNNGGDGSVVARHLFLNGWDVALVLAAKPAELSGDALLNWEVAQKCGVPCYVLDDGGRVAVAQRSGSSIDLCQLLARSDVTVDALLGTGASKAPRGLVALAIETINSCARHVVSLDVPSGIDAATGQVPGVCVRARETITFCRPKAGMMQYPAADYCGRIWVAAISIPDSYVSKVNPRLFLTTRETARAGLPKRKPWFHKGDLGRALLFAGSARYPGAALLCSIACLRAGAGLVTLATPSSLWAVYASRLQEVMLYAAGGSQEGTFAQDSVDAARDLLETADALAVGPGISTGEPVASFLIKLFETNVKPIVIDADALNLVSSQSSVRDAMVQCALRAPVIVTPHPGEAARLLQTSVKRIQEDRVSAVRTLAQSLHCVAVLKGARTVIASPDGRVWVNPTGNPGLASGGSGDVLTGCIASLLAQGADALAAARTGVFIHGLAADILAPIQGEAGMSAGDVTQALPRAIATLSGDECDAPSFMRRA